MRIEKVERKVVGVKGKKLQVNYFDTETNRTYSRVISGIGWLWASRPGAVITVGEESQRDHSLTFSPRHCFLLEEFYSQDLEELHRRCLRNRTELCATTVVGNPNNSLYSLWTGYGDGAASIPISEPPNLEIIDLNFAGQLIRKRTSLAKTLHFGEGYSLPGHLSTLGTGDIEGKPLESYPPVAALAYILSEFENSLREGTFTPRRTRTARNPRYGR